MADSIDLMLNFTWFLSLDVSEQLKTRVQAYHGGQGSTILSYLTQSHPPGSKYQKCKPGQLGFREHILVLRVENNHREEQSVY